MSPSTVLLVLTTTALEPLLLEEVLENTHRAAPTLVAARADERAADGEALSAQGGFDPTWKTRAANVPVGGYPNTRLDTVIEAPTPLWGASLFGGYRLGFGKFPDYYGDRVTWSAGEVRAGVTVPVLRNGPIDRRRVNLARAELGQRLAGLAVEQQTLELTRIATGRYWDWVAAGRRLEVAEGLLAIARTRDEWFTARAKVGEVASIDRDDNRRAVVQREAFVVQARRALEQAAFELSLFVRPGDDATTIDPARLPPTLQEPLVPLRANDELTHALSRRPDVGRLAVQRTQAALEVELAKNQLLPGLDLSVAVSKDLGNSPGSGFDSLGPTQLELGLVLDVPLLLRAPLGKVRSAEAATSRLDAQLRLARERVKVELDDARSAIDAAASRLGLARQEIALTTNLERGERSKFELGDSSLLFVNLREQATAEARLREIDALVELHRGVAALLAARGAEATGSIRAR